MSTVNEPLGKHVAPRLGRERLARQWDAIAARTGPRPRRLPWPMAAAVGVALAVIATVVGLRRTPSAATTAATLVDGTWLESAPSGPPPGVVLPDGSRVALGASSRLRLTRIAASDVRLDLERGRVDVQATHRAGRSFVVVAAGVEVRVVGTKFSVEADGPVRVRVEEGRVQVRDAAGERFVASGEEWAETSPSAKPPASAEPDESAPAAGEPPSARDEAATPGRAAPQAGSSSPDAKKLLGDAQRAIAQGKTQDAARLLDDIRRDHSRDPRAALAAFELGRLRLDALGDAAGADDAFRDAIRLARDTGLRDDAEARHVQALEAMGSRSACVRARAAYLAAHPGGVHRAEVSGRCGGP